MRVSSFPCTCTSKALLLLSILGLCLSLVVAESPHRAVGTHIPTPPPVPSAITVAATALFPNEYSASFSSARLDVQAVYSADTGYYKSSYGDHEEDLYIQAKASRAVFHKFNRTVCVNAQGNVAPTDPGVLLIKLLSSNRTTWRYGGSTDMDGAYTDANIQIWRIVTPGYLGTIYWDAEENKPISLEMTTLTIGYQVLYEIKTYSATGSEAQELKYPSLCDTLEPLYQVNLTNFQIKRIFKGLKPFPKAVLAKTLPKVFDLRTEGIITPVKEQRACGSCWAHAVAGAVELAVMRTSGESLTLSEQELIDCASWEGAMQLNAGCFGGSCLVGMEYVARSKGLHLRNNYIYQGINSACKLANLTARNIARSASEVAGYYSFDGVYWAGSNLTFRNMIKEAIYRFGGVTVGYYAEPCRYLKGDEICKVAACLLSKQVVQDRDHAVQLVGWGPDYWIFKNSWGIGWADGGYGRIDMIYDCGMGLSMPGSMAIPYLSGWEQGIMKVPR